MRGVYNEDMRLLKLFDINTQIAEFEIDDYIDEDIHYIINAHEYITFNPEDLSLYYYNWGSNEEKLKVKTE